MRIALFNLHFKTLGGGERRTAALAEHLSRSHEVTLYVLEPANLGVLQRTFGVDLSAVEIVPLAGRAYFEVIASAQPDLFINNSHHSRLPSPAPLGIYMCMFPDRNPSNLIGYQVVTANSDFTARWIAERWGHQAEVVYSACQSMGPPLPKEKIILNVGRFFADEANNHHKGQDLLLDAFLSLADARTNGWEMHFVGNLGHQPGDEAFVRYLQDKGGGAVHFHCGASLEMLRDLYRRASIYWHATGFGYNPKTFPEKQEHFGMSIVEAMSTGAVPVAFRAGGPCEIIEHDHSGFLWRQPEELLSETRALIADETLRQSISAQAMVRSDYFTRGRFLGRMDAIIRQLVADKPEVAMCAS